MSQPSQPSQSQPIQPSQPTPSVELDYRLVRDNPIGDYVRIYFPDADPQSVVDFLREQALGGFVGRSDMGMPGVGQSKIISLRQSARYALRARCGVNLPTEPNSVSLTFTRDWYVDPGCWHLSLRCVSPTGYRPYVPEEGQPWVVRIFGPHVADLKSELVDVQDATAPGSGLRPTVKQVAHFRLECDWRNPKDVHARWW